MEKSAHNRHAAGTDTSFFARYRRAVDVVDRVLTRLERIESLERGQAGKPVLLEELRMLVGEAEAWAREEGDERACGAVEKLRKEAEGMR